MRSSFFLAAALGATSIFAAPTWPALNLDAANPDSLEVLSDYFNMLSGKVQAGKLMGMAPVCDLSKAQQSLPPTPLSTPREGLTLSHMAIGRGTQNYTCEDLKPTDEPKLFGAVATLFNASCIASTYPDLANMLPRLALKFDLTDMETVRMGPTNLAISGAHYFTLNTTTTPESTTPYFNLNTEALTLGYESFAKAEETATPADAPKGRNGEDAVKWLKLNSMHLGEGNLQEVYRLQTAGGSPPKTCEGMPDRFQVEYAAQYWFYQGVNSE